MERDFWPMEWLPTPTLMCWSWTRTDWGRLGLTILIAEPSCTLKELHLFCNVSRNNICFKEGFEWSTDSLSVHWCPWYDCHMQGSGDQQTLTVHWFGHEQSQKGQWCKSDHLQVDDVWLYFREEQLLLFPCWPSTHLWRHSVSSSTTSLTPGPSSELCLAPRLYWGYWEKHMMCMYIQACEAAGGGSIMSCDHPQTGGKHLAGIIWLQ